jgi:asparagine synthase (glutamine-hydrolysing)
VSARLEHRGPDATREIHLDRFAAAHTRLAIIDLAGGAQPMTDPATGTVIVFNGEIYNFVELRNTLTNAGYRFHTHSDTEVLLKCYVHYGMGMLEHLNGMFAFAIYDPRRGVVFLARDRYGQKPLYWFRAGDRFYFASQLDAIAQFDECPTTFSELGLLDYFATGYVSGPGTILEGVQQIRHAHYLYVTADGTVREQPYYHVPFPEATGPISDDEIADTLQTAVSLRMRADVPVASLLSGGIDSSLVTALAQRTQDRPIHTFAFGWKGIPDELPYAREIADFVGTSHHEIELDRGVFMADLEKSVEAMDMPLADSASFVVYELAKHIAQAGVKVVLSGDGGDEVFGGYRWIRGSGFRNAVKQRLRSRRRRARDYVEGKHIFERESLTRAFSPALLNGLVDERTEALLALGGDSVPGRMLYDFAYLLPWGLLPKVDRMSMAHSIEVRAPLLDKHLVRLWSRLPVRDKVDADELKVRIRRFSARANLFPASVLTRPKMGMNLPVTWWLQENVSFFRDLLLNGDCSTVDVFGRGEVEAWFRELAATRTQGWSKPAQRIWAGTIFELWRHEFRTRVLRQRKAARI